MYFLKHYTIQADFEGLIEFGQYAFSTFWVQKKNIVRWLCERSNPLIIAFPISYFVEKGFSTVIGLHTKQRNGLDIVKNGGLSYF